MFKINVNTVNEAIRKQIGDKMENKELKTVDQNLNEVSVTESRHMSLIETAITGKADIATIEKLVELQDKFEKKQAKKSFFKDLSLFQSDIPTISKNGSADYGHGKAKYNFAKIEDIANSINPLLSKHVLSYRFEQEIKERMVRVFCIVTHKDGHQEINTMTAPADTSGSKNSIQQLASTVTYLRRYTLTGGLGITTGDCDNDAQSYEKPQDNKQQHQEKSVNYYTDDQFKRSLPAWKDSLSKGKTVEMLIEFVGKRGFIFNEEQTKTLDNLGV